MSFRGGDEDVTEKPEEDVSEQPEEEAEDTDDDATEHLEKVDEGTEKTVDDATEHGNIEDVARTRMRTHTRKTREDLPRGRRIIPSQLKAWMH